MRMRKRMRELCIIRPKGEKGRRGKERKGKRGGREMRYEKRFKEKGKKEREGE